MLFSLLCSLMLKVTLPITEGDPFLVIQPLAIPRFFPDRSLHEARVACLPNRSTVSASSSYKTDQLDFRSLCVRPQEGRAKVDERSD